MSRIRNDFQDLQRERIYGFFDVSRGEKNPIKLNDGTELNSSILMTL
jgi:hypothetical protein